jgi:YbbR domain-containing protein
MQGIARIFQETIQLFIDLGRPVVRSLSDNRGLAALSVVLAFGLWIFVTDTENPTRTRVLPIDITVQPINVPDDVAIASDIASLRLRITVADDVFDSLVAGDFEAIVDLDGLTVGSYELPVDVRALTGRGGLRIDEPLPDTVTVDLAQLTGKSVPVQIDVTGEPAPGFTMGSPVIDDETVLVTGPQDEVDQVSQVTATIDVTARTSPVDQAVRLTPRNDRGFLVQRVNLEPSITGVTIDIEQEKFSRSVVVSVVTEGEPATGYNVVSVSVDPPTVTVRGTQSFITNVDSIDTRPVDIEGADKTVVRSVSLDIPAGAEVTAGAQVVTVTVTIGPATSEFNFTVPVTAANLASNASIVGALPSAAVKLIGPYPILSEVSAADISATVNLNGLGAGTHSVKIEVAQLAGVTVAGVTPEEIDVVVESR